MRRSAPWLAVDSPAPLRYGIVTRALLDVGLIEDKGTNRGTRIDAYTTATKAPLGSPWCASAVYAWASEAGYDAPKADQASVDVWLRWAVTTTRWVTYVANKNAPTVGDILVYGVKREKPEPRDWDGQHIGVVIRVEATPQVWMSVEGNTSLAPKSREGLGVMVKQVERGWVLGWITPERSDGK